jgi:2,3-bisphosphoglycerate-dependent phosphoglycerate mutase
MSKLILLRHLKSQWNLENRFTGWTDIPLSKEGIESVKGISEKIKNERIDAVYTSPLKRNVDTASLILKNLRQENLPLVVDKALNERNYGILTGLNKDEMMDKYGKEKIHLWRRSYNVAPPGGESLKDVFERTTPFFKEHVEKDLGSGKNVLIVASHNSLRAIMKYVEKISDDKIIEVEIPYGGVTIYDFKDGIYSKDFI